MKILFVSWRNGRPRFQPSPSLRRQGHQGHDLKIPDPETGALRWMTEGEALDWSNAFRARRDGEKEKARETRRRAEEKKAREAAKILPSVQRRSYTLGQMLEEFQASGTRRLAPATVRLYSELRKMIEAEAPVAYAAEATSISRPTVIGLYELLEEARGRSMSHHGIQYLRRVYNWAIDREKLTVPGSRVQMGNPATRIETDKPGPRVRTLTLSDWLHFVAAADAAGFPDVGDMLVWGALGGQRAGDRLAMTPATIVEGRACLTQMKTGQDVAVTLSKHILARLKARPVPKGAKSVIRHPETGDPMPYPTYAGRYRKARLDAAKARPQLADFHDQDLRDTAISWLAAAGCTDFEIMAVSGHGHAGRTRVLGHYLKIDHQLADTAISKLDRWLDREIRLLKQKGARR